MSFASSFLIIPKKKLNENNRQKKARNEFIIRLHIFIRDFEIQTKIFFRFFYKLSEIQSKFPSKLPSKSSQKCTFESMAETYKHLFS